MENNEEKKAEEPVGEMQKRRKAMSDGKRYIIYYTFGDEKIEPQPEVTENV